jgi:alkane 1-monooxygenase
MSAATSLEVPAISTTEVVKIWSRHLVSLLLPLNALAFLISGPHAWYIAPLFLIPIGVAYALDGGDRVETRQPVEGLPAWPFDGLVYLLAAIQLWIVFELARMFALQSFFSIDTLLVFVIVGGGSGFSIITAHELIHRRNRWEQGLGRLLLCTVLNEHFYTEHLRGHHVRVGTPDDPATARFGETYEHFYWRTIRGQFSSAWRIEMKRLGNPSRFDPRMLRNRILQGLALGWGIALVIGYSAGAVAFAVFLLQAFSASRLLEAVNYFEHWGLTRSAHRVGPADSWDTHAWFTYYGLTGLSRHADHHAEPARPFQQLRVMDEAPILSGGYVRMVDMVTGKNDDFRREATEELERRRLGPFAPGASPPAEPEGRPPKPADGSSGGLRGWWLQLHPRVRQTLSYLGLLVAITVGAGWEAGTPFFPRLSSNLWIAAVFGLGFYTHALAVRRTSNEAIAWAMAFAVLIGLGRAGEMLIG